ncbi:MAG: ABC transporter substrate-binding protein [Candidatus Rokuibacteriota bacterium]
MAHETSADTAPPSTSGVSRRRFLASSGAAAGVAGLGWLAGRTPPAFAQRRTLTALALSLFVPSGDERLGQLMEEFGKLAGCDVRFDTVKVTDVPVKLAAEATAQAGHDLVNVWEAFGYLHRSNLADIDDVVEDVGRRHGVYPGHRATFHIDGHWKVAPWYWLSFVGTYNVKHWRAANLPLPKTWDDLHRAGADLKKRGAPIGIGISNCTDAILSWRNVMWCYGAKEVEADGKTLAINSPKTVEFVEFAKRLYMDAMSPEVLSWDDAGNNRLILSGKGSWVHNPVSIYLAARDKDMPIAAEIDHHEGLAGPAGRFAATFHHGLGIWKFSKNVDLAKDFLRFLYQEDKFGSWIAAAKGFCMSPFRKFEGHEVWNKDAKLTLLPKEGPYTRPQGWPGPPSQYIGAMDAKYLVPNMIAKAVTGTPVKEAILWMEREMQKVYRETL